MDNNITLDIGESLLWLLLKPSSKARVVINALYQISSDKVILLEDVSEVALTTIQFVDLKIKKVILENGNESIADVLIKWTSGGLYKIFPSDDGLSCRVFGSSTPTRDWVAVEVSGLKTSIIVQVYQPQAVSMEIVAGKPFEIK